MKRSISLASLALAASCAAVPGSHPTGPDGTVRNVSLHFGERRLESDEFPGIDEPAVVGVELDWYRPDAAFGYEIGVFYAHDEDDLVPSGEFEATTTELSFGIRKTFELEALPRVYPYVGGGLTVFYTEKDFSSPAFGTADEDDLDAGLYVHGGIRGRLAGDLTLGVDLRVVTEELGDYGGFDMDYEQLTLTLGFAF